MNKRLRVILYGKSIILGTVGASLAHYSDLEIVDLAAPLPGVEDLAALAPDVILFDVDLGRPDAAFSLLKNCPCLLLVGVNPEDGQVRLWSSSQEEVVTADHLLQLISRANVEQKI